MAGFGQKQPVNKTSEQSQLYKEVDENSTRFPVITYADFIGLVLR
jgi:hypothetical protein